MSDDAEIENDDYESDDDSSFEASSDDSYDVGGMSARDNIRQQLQSDVEAFLAAGGQIREIAPNVVSDPPKKPQSNYGGQPI